MFRLFEKIKNIIAQIITAGQFHIKEPVKLTVKDNLINHIFLSDQSNPGIFLPVFGDTVYFPFYKALPYPNNKINIDAGYFGVGEITLKEKLEVKYHFLPIFFPEIIGGFDKDRDFNFQTVLGKNLIFSLCSKERIEYDHFLYSFDRETKSWYNIKVVSSDGDYEKISMNNGNYPDFPTESPDNRFRTFFGSLIVWGKEDNRLCVGSEDKDDYAFHTDTISESSPEFIQHLEERGDYNKRFCKTNLFGGFNHKELLIRRFIGSDIVPLYSISDIYDFFQIHDMLSKDVYIIVNGSFPIRYEGKNSIAVFINYGLPKRWQKSLFMIFDCGEEDKARR
jgi:hypothetical protein